MGLFAIGHTYGALVNTPSLGPMSDRVVAMMQSVQVLAQGSRTSWYDFYLAFGYGDTISLLFSMVVAWFLGGKLPEERRALWPIAWALLVSQICGLVIALCFLFPAPIILSGVLVLLLSAGCLGDALSRS